MPLRSACQRSGQVRRTRAADTHQSKEVGVTVLQTGSVRAVGLRHAVISISQRGSDSGDGIGSGQGEDEWPGATRRHVGRGQRSRVMLAARGRVTADDSSTGAQVADGWTRSEKKKSVRCKERWLFCCASLLRIAARVSRPRLQTPPPAPAVAACAGGRCLRRLLRSLSSRLAPCLMPQPQPLLLCSCLRRSLSAAAARLCSERLALSCQ